MKIAIDISQIAHTGTGVARYMSNLVRAILQFDAENDYTFFFSSLRGSLPRELEEQISAPHRLVKLPIPPSLLEPLFNRFRHLPIERLVGPVDLFISSDWTQPKTVKAKKITIVHDLVYLKYPETMAQSIVSVQQRRMSIVKKEIDLILADSESTRQDIVGLLQIPQGKIKVLFPAVEVIEPTEDTIKRTIDTYNIDKPFILSVGKLEPRKNIPRLISAFQKANLKDIELLIVGPQGWASRTPRGWRDQTNIKFLGLIPDPDLYALYKKALFFIYPSLYEGFGLPIVEAMALGCPVATSDTSSMKEIAQGYCLLFNPESESEITDAILKLVRDEKTRNNFAKLGGERAQDFTIDKYFANFNRLINL